MRTPKFNSYTRVNPYSGATFLNKKEFFKDRDPYEQFVVFNATFDNNTKGYDMANSVAPTFYAEAYISGYQANAFPYYLKYPLAAKLSSGYAILDGTNDRIVYTNNNYILGTSNFTIEMWTAPLNGGAGSSYGRLFLLGTDGTNGCFAIIRANNPNPLLIFAQTYSSGWSDVISTNSAPIYDNTWNHIAITRSGNTYRYYLNGIFVVETTNGTGNNLTGNTICLGTATTGASNFYNGKYRAVRITKKVRYNSNFIPEREF
jgi:hypothetical protein